MRYSETDVLRHPVQMTRSTGVDNAGIAPDVIADTTQRTV